MEPGIILRAVPPGPLTLAMETPEPVLLRCRMPDGWRTFRFRVRVLAPEGGHDDFARIEVYPAASDVPCTVVEGWDPGDD